MSLIVSKALAKVNLALNITGKTSSGYHEMQSIFAFLQDLYDELIFNTDQEFDEKAVVIPGVENNSILKAYTILRSNFDLKIPYVKIIKSIPICGGLGGGSSDAACFINTVFDYWGFTQKEKMTYTDIFRPLGADTKVFLFKYFTNSRFVYIDGTGIDGAISNIDLPYIDKYILIINDGTQLSTRQVFENFKEPFCQNVSEPRQLLLSPHNSLQNSALELAPHLQDILDIFDNMSPIFYGISGSGASCFAMLGNAQIDIRRIPYEQVILSNF